MLNYCNGNEFDLHKNTQLISVLLRFAIITNSSFFPKHVNVFKRMTLISSISVSYALTVSSKRCDAFELNDLGMRA